MVKVYFENDNWYTEVVAIFDDEDTYMDCLPALEKRAKENGFDRVTESIIEDDETLEEWEAIKNK